MLCIKLEDAPLVEPVGLVNWLVRSVEMDSSLEKEKQLMENIKDHIEENPIADDLVVQDVDINRNKMEALRKVLRSVHNNIKKATTSDDYTDLYREGNAKAD